MARKRIIGLDALRCFAIALVVAYHCFSGVLPGGFLAVEMFFVVSGFLTLFIGLQRNKES